MDRPSFLVLGAPKCGTTSLCHYLAQHPEVFVPPEKEPRFFDAEYERGLDYYWSRYFRDWSGQAVAGEGRIYLLFLPFVPGRIRESLPDARMIAILRNPIDRAYSHWWHRYTARNETLAFEPAIERNLEQIEAGVDFAGHDGAQVWREGLVHETAMASSYRLYLDCGLYARQLRRYFETFPREQLRVVYYDDLVADAEAMVRELWGFIGVAPDAELVDLTPRNAARAVLESRWRRGARRLARSGMREWVPRPLRVFASGLFVDRPIAQPVMSGAARERLLEFFREPNRELEALLGRSFADWSH